MLLHIVVLHKSVVVVICLVLLNVCGAMLISCEACFLCDVQGIGVW